MPLRFRSLWRRRQTGAGATSAKDCFSPEDRAPRESVPQEANTRRRSAATMPWRTIHRNFLASQTGGGVSSVPDCFSPEDRPPLESVLPGASTKRHQAATTPWRTIHRPFLLSSQTGGGATGVPDCFCPADRAPQETVLPAANTRKQSAATTR